MAGPQRNATPADVEEVLDEFAHSLQGLGVVGLYLGGSAAAGTYEPALSDLDLVAVLRRRIDAGCPDSRGAPPAADPGQTGGRRLHCAYVVSAQATDVSVEHLTWSHAQMHRRIVSGVTRAELQTFGRTLFGPPPASTFPAVSPAELRAAVRGELTGYWRNAVRRRPGVWLDPLYVDLGLITLARADATLRTATHQQAGGDRAGCRLSGFPRTSWRRSRRAATASRSTTPPRIAFDARSGHAA